MEQVDDNTFKYFAFISYNSKDTDWGKRLQRNLSIIVCQPRYVVNMVGNANP